MKHLLSSICLCLPLLFCASSHAADLQIEITDVKSSTGNLLIALYDSTETFLKKPVKGVKVAAQSTQTSVQVSDLPAGDYAIVVFHDLNDNGKLDRNPAGMPIEDYAFGNNALGKMGPPSFLESKISLPAAGGNTRLSLR